MGQNRNTVFWSWLNEFPTIRCWMCHASLPFHCQHGLCCRPSLSVCLSCLSHVFLMRVCVYYIHVDVVPALFSGCVCSGPVLLIKVSKHYWDKLMFLMCFSHMTCPLLASSCCSKPFHLSSSHSSFLTCHFVGCSGLSELFYSVFPYHP